MASIRRPGHMAYRPLHSAVLLVAVLWAGERCSTCQAAEERALPSDLALVPSDGGVFVTVRVADLATSKAGKQILTHLRRDKDNVATDLERDLGVPLADIERLTVLPMGLWIVRTTRPYDREKLLDALAPKGQRQKYKDKTYYKDDSTATELFLVDEQVFVKAHSYAPGLSGLAWIWDRKVNKDGALGEALQLAAQKHHFVAGVTPAALFLGLVERPPVPAAVQERSSPVPGPKPKELPKDSAQNEEQADPPPPVNVHEERRLAEPSIEQMLQQLPLEFLPFKPLLQARLATVVGDLGDEAKLQLQVSFPDKETAKDGETALKTGLYVLRELLPRALGEVRPEPESAKQIMAILKKVQSAVKAATVANEGSVVSAAMSLEVDPAALGIVALQMRGSAEQIKSINNLKQIVLAMHNFHDTMGFMPPAAICSKDGKPLLSWRVAILPYIEEDNLYKQFKLDEPWDGPNNKKLLERMPKIYTPVKKRSKQPYSTYYQVFTGPQAPFHQKADGSKPFGARGPRLPANFPDGTSNTLLVVEAAEAVPWSKPEDLVYDAKKPVPKLGAEFNGGFIGAMADGSVRFFRNDLDEQLLRYLIMPADGMPIDWNAIEGKQGESKRVPKSAAPPSSGIRQSPEKEPPPKKP